ncbi:ATP synthase F1 subunit gamma [Defluviitalea raffinosedens]|uniref:ATP synthase F1 subunit gamma n=1 Tax=Defluviitalea raffinosedens TaxID=1450156 RepID=UPI00195BED77|nr:ATP synthase F1 subunit gamma [Defluviitalea raffinosedens]MBM7684543.1 F-type H+-transporting ATPase subunit gamma [Defluviitalea raffinosedens]
MASIRTIKRRIKSVHSTSQITKAMKLVSTAKMQKARRNVEETRPFFITMQKTISSVVHGSKGITHPYIKEREVKNTMYIVIASDRGLAGGYNSNVCKLALQHIGQKQNVKLITIGKKSRDFFNRRKYSISNSYLGISENPKYAYAARVGETVLDLYNKEEIDEVYLVYTAFKSMIHQVPTVKKLLPVDVSEFKTDKESKEQDDVMIYEPSPEGVLEYVIPKYINSVIYGAMVESAASEQGARMTAMDSATENAMDIIERLTVEYNRARQASITQEITEIVGGSEALK